MNRIWLSKYIVLIVIAVNCFYNIQIAKGALPEARDLMIPPNAPYKPDELIVRFAPKGDSKQRNITEKIQLLSSLGGGTITQEYTIVPGLSVVRLPPGLTVEDALKTYNAADEILYAEPDCEIPLLSPLPNDTRFDELWGMHNTGQTGGTTDADIDALEAWDITTNANIIVAIIDSGIDYTHSDLAANMWVNEVELNGDPNVDDDGNGYIDDIRGWDFYDNNNDPMDFLGHGTHCAGTVGAVGNNSEGVTGVCWNVKIMAVNISHYGTEGWVTFASNAVEGIQYAVDNGAKVLSNSWGGSTHVQALKDAVEAADANGVLFVAAAGNEGYDNDYHPLYPASYDCNNIISVMATDHDDHRSVWPPDSSNYGLTTVDLAAPGSGILSCVPGNDYESWDGTSMATPHVTGACALVWSRNPHLSHLQVKDVVLSSVDKIEALDALCVTGGRLNLHSAVLEAASLTFSKDDNLDASDCLIPGEYVTYTITYGNPITDANDPAYLGDVNDVNIIDQLPHEIDPFDVNVSGGGVYDMWTNTVTWNIGTLSPGEQNSVTVTVSITADGEPCGVVTNVAVLEGEKCRKIRRKYRPLGCFGPDVIHVDAAATAYKTGTSWANAYTDLQSALARARAGCGSEIWVAAGTYKPTTDPDDEYGTFQLPDGVPLYGGFAGNETARDRRNWLQNETILTGDIDGDGQHAAHNNTSHYVVTASDINNATIDGFTITMSFLAAIYSSYSSITIQHSLITDNEQDGIKCTDYSNCKIANCVIEYNGSYGITCDGQSATITNNWICNNSTGIDLWTVNLVRNNTVAYNTGYAINTYDPAWGCPPANISNCIVWANEAVAFEPYSGGTYNVTYSCIQGGWSGTGNISDDPIFMNVWDFRDQTADDGTNTTIRVLNPQQYHEDPPDVIEYDNDGVARTITDVDEPNYIITFDTPLASSSKLGVCIYNWGPAVTDVNENYHLQSDSPCIDTGDPDLDLDDPNETDIDGEARIKYGRVDMGADEFYWSPADFNRDQHVDFSDYALLAAAWRTAPPDPDYNDICDLHDNNAIDYNDLALFCEEWLWQAGWTRTFNLGFPLGMGLDSGPAEALYSPETVEKLQAEPEQASQQPEPQFDIEELLTWLEDIWLDEEVRSQIPEDEWLKFIEAVKADLQ